MDYMYKLDVNIKVNMNPKSWKKTEYEELLQHETGHYLIGCLCALEFKRRCCLNLFT